MIISAMFLIDKHDLYQLEIHDQVQLLFFNLIIVYYYFDLDGYKLVYVGRRIKLAQEFS